MNAKPHPRHERNRHHLASTVSAALGIVLLLSIYIVLPQSRWICIASAIVSVLVLFGRTLVIESGFRRRLNGAEAAIEHHSRRRIESWFGITAIEEYRSDSDSEDETTTVRGDA